MKTKTLKILPLGGLEEIGKNMMILEYHNEIIIIDCGLKFPNHNTFGVDYIINDYDYLIQNKHKLKGILITHGHLDHIGGLPYILRKVNIPIYAHKFTAALINKILDNNNIKQYRINSFNTEEEFKIGNFFRCEAIDVWHSIIDSVLFIIQTPIGNIIHSGDYRIKNITKLQRNNRLKFYIDKGIKVLMADSTNAASNIDIANDEEIEKNFASIISKNKSRIFIATFATQIDRIKTILSLAKKYNKDFAFSGRSMKENIELALGMKYLEEYKSIIKDIENVENKEKDNLIILCTGTQGEKNSILNKMAAGKHQTLKIKKNDIIVLSSSIIPGNELRTYEMLNSFYKLGVLVFTNSDLALHSTGHANSAEIEQFIKLIKPKYLIPIHGESRHLYKHKEISIKCGVPKQCTFIIENGQMIEMGENIELKICEKLSLQNVYIENGMERSIPLSVFKEREQLKSHGIISISIRLNKQEIFVSIKEKGLSVNRKNEKQGDLNFEFLKNNLQNYINKHKLLYFKDKEKLEKKIKNQVCQYFNESRRRVPIIISHME